MSDLADAAQAATQFRSLTPRQRERRARILDAAYALLARHGYDAMSTKMIASHAGVAERTLFNIYKTKDALIAAAARERSEGFIEEAWSKASDQGIGFFLSLCETLSRRTLEAPEVARALAPVLVQQADLVALHEVYRRYVGRALEDLVDQDALNPAVIDVVNALVMMRMVSAVTLWAAQAIADETLEVHMRLGVCEVLLPHVRGPSHDWSLEEARRCVDVLAQRPGRTAP